MVIGRAALFIQPAENGLPAGTDVGLFLLPAGTDVGLFLLPAGTDVGLFLLPAGTDAAFGTNEGICATFFHI
ncbi:hypothetical protein Tco_0450802, partial [Tanacetum coccineum]